MLKVSKEILFAALTGLSAQRQKAVDELSLIDANIGEIKSILGTGASAIGLVGAGGKTSGHSSHTSSHGVNVHNRRPLGQVAHRALGVAQDTGKRGRPSNQWTPKQRKEQAEKMKRYWTKRRKEQAKATNGARAGVVGKGKAKRAVKRAAVKATAKTVNVRAKKKVDVPLTEAA